LGLSHHPAEVRCMPASSNIIASVSDGLKEGCLAAIAPMTPMACRADDRAVAAQQSQAVCMPGPSSRTQSLSRFFCAQSGSETPTGLLRAASSPSAAGHRPGATPPPTSPPPRNRDGAGPSRRSPPDAAPQASGAPAASPFALALQTPPAAGSDSARAGVSATWSVLPDQVAR